MATWLITVNDILAGHVSLDVACLDRIHRNGYLPTVRSTTRRSLWPGGGRLRTLTGATRRPGDRPTPALPTLSPRKTSSRKTSSRPCAVRRRPSSGR
jgi:hypothetical protein